MCNSFTIDNWLFKIHHFLKKRKPLFFFSCKSHCSLFFFVLKKFVNYQKLYLNFVFCFLVGFFSYVDLHSLLCKLMEHRKPI